MLKKIIKNSLLCLMLMFATYIISACCGPKMCEITVNFNNVDESLGLSNYTETIEAGYGVNVKIDVPEGYVYENFSAKVGDYDLDWTVDLSDPLIEPEYEYTIDRTITVTIDRVNADHIIDIDMSGVKLKKIKVNVAQDILDNSITEDSKNRKESNLQLVTINPNYLDNLMYLRGDAIINQTPVGIVQQSLVNFTGEAYVNYGEYIIFCYTKDNSQKEMPTIYSSVGKFTSRNNIIEHKNNEYAQLDMATKGNVPHYLYENNSAVTNSRLYYLGQLKEDLDLYKNIPDLTIEKGVSFEDKENQFVLITNKQDHNSELLSISLFAPTTDNYSEQNDTIDKIDNVVLKKIEKYTNEGELKTPSIYSEYGKRYDMVSMYIGDTLSTDILLTDSERANISSTLYLVIESEIPLEKLDISLLSYEKQTMEDYPILKLTDYEKTAKNRNVFKLNKSIINNFINERTDSESGEKYLLGNAFLDVTFSNALHTENRKTKDYTTLLFPIKSIGIEAYYSNDYLVEIFVEDEEGNRDYGLIDRHTYNEDIVFFKTSQLYVHDGSNYVARRDLYITIIGPEYNDFYSPVIDSIFLYKPYDVPLLGQDGIRPDPKVLNGVIKQSINVNMEINNVNNTTFVGNQLRIEVCLNLTTNNTSVFNVDFSGLTFTDEYNDAIYMSNDIDFDSMDDFTRIDSIVVDADTSNIKFGYYKDIYYFVYSEDENLEFDIYVGQENPSTQEFEGKFDVDRQISNKKILKDILGNTVRVTDNKGRVYVVYTKYQSCDVYSVKGSEHFAYNPNSYSQD